MNNNQDNLNINPQIPNMNQNSSNNQTQNVQSRFFNQPPPQNIQNPVIQEQQSTPSLNVIPTMGETPQPTPMNQPINNIAQISELNNIQGDSSPEFNSIQNNDNNITNINQSFGNENQESLKNINVFNETSTPPPIQTSLGGFSEVNDELKIESSNRFIKENIDANNSLNELNIEEEFSNIPRDYSNDAKVQHNLEQEKKKNTITITGEMKVFLLIIAVLLLFTFVMPYIFDFFRNI